MIIPWALCIDQRKKNGDFECLDGQQRTISICEFLNSNFSIQINNNPFNFDILDDIDKNQILNYELTVYICEGTEKETLNWFKIINIAGETLFEQEMRNAIYSSNWLTDAKRYFSRRNNPGNIIFGAYHNKKSIRQELLELILKWLSHEQNISIEEYMLKQQKRKDASFEWNYLNKVKDWIESLFEKIYKDMQKVEWGFLYYKYHQKKWNKAEINALVEKLRKDSDVKNKAGIYEYVFDPNPKYLNLRAFENNDIISVWEQQNKTCRNCGREIAENEARGDHIKPWSKGGKTQIDNLQVLCSSCNSQKSDKY